MFSGIGGFEYGIQKSYNEYAHISKESEPEECTQRRERPTDKRGTLLHSGNRAAPLCVGYSEIDKFAKSIYKKHYPENINWGDATKIKTEELPDFHCLVAGFPCQAFSIAGKRRGFEDTRGTLFFEIGRILKDKRPRYFVLENVKGLLSHDKGKTFQTILEVLTSLGYGIEWQVLNSKDWGVPQNRERVFIIGHLGRQGGGKVFPLIRESSETYGINQINTGVSDAQRIFNPENGLSCTLKALGGGQGAKTGLYAIPTSKDNNAYCLDSNYHKGCNELNKSRRTQVIDNFRIRRLTPVECERLQGFPDNYTQYGFNGKKISDTQRYKSLGNAVTTNVVKVIFDKLFKIYN